jgi:hypothetical protein
MNTRKLLVALLAIGFLPGVVRADYASEVLADHPVIYYRMNETSGATATDSAGPTWENGVYVNGPLLGEPSDPRAIPGALGTSVQFGTGGPPATDQLIDVNVVAPITSWGGVTYEFWMYADSFDRWTAVCNNDGWNYGSVHCQFENNYPLVGIKGSDPGSNFAFKRTTFDVERWYYVVLAVNIGDASAHLYIDGEWAQTLTKGYIPSPIYIANAQIANWRDNQRNLVGRYDEMAIYTYELSAGRIQAHWEAAVPEPATLGMLALGGLVVLRRRR